MHNGAPVHFMNRQQIQEIILRVLAECGEQGKEQELPLDFPVEVSAKHVHLTREAVEQLFGTGAKLTPKRPLSQPGQFLSEERVTLVTSKGRIENVAVLGPERAAVQTELSLTDCRTLGIDAPLRMSGDLTGAGDVYIIGSMGMIHAKGSVIIAHHPASGGAGRDYGWSESFRDCRSGAQDHAGKCNMPRQQSGRPCHAYRF